MDHRGYLDISFKINHTKLATPYKISHSLQNSHSRHPSTLILHMKENNGQLFDEVLQNVGAP